MMAQGCRRRATAAPVQQVVQRMIRVQPNFPVGPLPVEDVDSATMTKVQREAPTSQPAQPVPVEVPPQPPEVQAAAVAESERQQDVRLLQEQQAASDRQQQELNQMIEENVRSQQEMQAEPRIQGIPEVPVQPAQEWTQQ
jgi:hypothetical protein